ncbi:calcium-binding protein [Limibacillus halophilus]|jgi:serralysin
MADINGTSDDDTLYGTSDADEISGLLGDDSLWGLAGDDIIDGGEGEDSVFYSDRFYFGDLGPYGVTVNLADGVATDTFGDSDTLISIEAAYGTDFADSFTGDSGDNYFMGLEGADYYDGGEGFDTVTYQVDPNPLDPDGGAGQGIYVNLQEEVAIDTQGDEEILVSIEAIRGSRFDDVIIGSDADNSLMGLDGDDYIDGGAGTDLVRYDRDARIVGEEGTGDSGVEVDLQRGFAIDGYGSEDTLRSIENVRGTNADDEIFGNHEANQLQGRAGDDLLVGRAGDDSLFGDGGNDLLFGDAGADRLSGGAGDDEMTGGGGKDIFVFADGDGNDLILDFQAKAGDLIDLSGQSEVLSFEDLFENHAQQTDEGVVLDLGSASGEETLTLAGVALDDLSAESFVLAFV